MAKETATNEASTEDIVDKKDPVQAKQEQFDESEEEPSEVRSADDEDEDEDPAEERDEGNMLHKLGKSPCVKTTKPANSKPVLMTIWNVGAERPPGGCRKS